MRLRMITVALLVLTIAVGAMAATTIPLTGEKPQMTLLSESRSSMTYRVEVGYLHALRVSTKAGDFSQIIIPGFHNSMIEGSPQLPQMNRLVAVPYDGSARLEVSNTVTRTINLAEHGLYDPLMPHQPSVSKSQNVEDQPFIYDEAAYLQARIEAPLASIHYQGRLRAMDIARLEIAPVAYMPASGEIEVVESLDVTLHFEGDWGRTDDLLAATYCPFFEPIYAQVDGNRQHRTKSDLVTYPVKMVIVTPAMFEAQFGDFIEWKTERGFEVITGVIGSPEVGTTTTSIQSFLHGLYNAGTPSDPAPSFVVFVGDIAQCPTWTLGGNSTDRPYCAVDADLFPDMYYGRLSATNSSMLQAILDKTMMYDTYSMPDPSYLSDVTLIAGHDNWWAPTHGNGTLRYGEDYYFNATHNIYAHAYYHPEAAGQASAIINNINNGVGFINFTAHCSATTWSQPTIGVSHVYNFTNAGKYGLAIGNCCNSSQYDIGECLAEAWLRAPNKGAIGYIGGSNSTYWHEDVYWSVGNLPQAMIRDGMTYEETGLGAYDGLFHSMPNEINDMSTWYVTNAAIMFAGNLAVTESGSSRIEYYWNIYNLMGDPSISTYLGTPQTNPMTYPTTVFVGVPSMTVAADPGTYIGLTQDGEIVGTGFVDLGGQVEITFNRILTPGVPLKMVAMAQNRVPVVEDLLVIVPAEVTIAPSEIYANVTTDITVTVMESDGVTPKPGIDVWAEGLEYQIAPVATGIDGVAVITVNYPFGPSLDIVGQEPGASYRLFTEQVTVIAQPLSAPALTVTTDIGMFDLFPLNLPGTLHATVGESGFTLYARMPDGTLHSTSASSLTVTAGQLGKVKGMIALSGYDLYTQDFDVVEAYGTVAGVVSSGGNPMPGVTVRLLDGMNNTVFSVVSGAGGAYAGPDEVLVDDYTLVVDHFGYLPYSQAIFVNYGANTFDIELLPAPAGVITGYVYASDTMLPLQANVKIYRSDTGELYNEVNSDTNGLYTTGSLPYFTYDVRVRAVHHIPVTTPITVDEPVVAKDWVLDPTAGDLLLIDDSTIIAAGDKYDENGTLLAPGYDPSEVKSAAVLAADLEELGYYVNVVGISEVDPASFWDHDLVVVACGTRTSTLQDAAIRNALVQFAQLGGKILLEGGEVGYNHRASGDFATYVMHTTTWNADSAGDIQGIATDHYVANHPNDLTTTTIQLTYTGYGDSDAMTPLPSAEMVMSWTTSTGRASVIAYNPNPSPIGGQIVFFTFNYAAAGAGRMDLLENTVLWLLTPEFGTSGVEGTATLAGESNHAGITVTAMPGGGSTVTAADGSYAFSGLYAGSYTIRASKSGWASASMDVALEEGQTLTGIDLVLQSTDGNILVIDDSLVIAAKDKLDEKGNVLEKGYDPLPDKSAGVLAAELEDLGYDVEVIDINSVDPATFWHYDLVVVSCGRRTSTLQNTAIRNALIQFAQAGGKILLEGGEVGWNHRNSGDFATYVMHTNTWNADSGGNIQGIATDHYVANHPNNLTATNIPFNYTGWGDSDVMTPLPSAETVMSWTTHDNARASVIAYDPNPNPVGGQIVFFTFNYGAAGAGRELLLENAVTWLLAEEFGDCAVEGTVLLAGETNHAGITVQALPGGGSTLTAEDGTYHIDGLYAGTYTIKASKDGWSVGTAIVTLEDGQTLPGVDMVLTPVATSEFCTQPNLPILDHQTTTSVMTVSGPNDAAITAVEVFIDITHTFIGDLIVTVISPCQTSVVLHNRTGGSADDIFGWYPGDFTPAQDLAAFEGLMMAGDWTLLVSDNASGDVGTLNEWCLRITHDTPVSVDQNDGPDVVSVPTVFRAYNNYPNPFNPMTTIKFDLPRASRVSLRIYDVAGRLVRTLVEQDLQAASHMFTWDATDDHGRRQASGVYYYRLVTDERTATHKMTLVK